MHLALSGYTSSELASDGAEVVDPCLRVLPTVEVAAGQL
jgi:hypothetical protein